MKEQRIYMVELDRETYAVERFFYASEKDAFRKAEMLAESHGMTKNLQSYGLLDSWENTRNDYVRLSEEILTM